MAHSEFTALVEVLADLRPNTKTLREMADFDDDDRVPFEELMNAAQHEAEAAVRDRLAPRYMACLLSDGQELVCELDHGDTRAHLERTLKLAQPLKVGDFGTNDYDLTRSMSRVIYEETRAVGIYARSAEDGKGYTTSLFESDRLDGTLRIGEALTLEGISRAATCGSLPDVIIYLNIVPAPPATESEVAGI